MTKEFSSDQKMRIIALRLKVAEGTAKQIEMLTELQRIGDELIECKAQQTRENEAGVFSSETLNSWRIAKAKWTDFLKRYVEQKEAGKAFIDELFSITMDE